MNLETLMRARLKVLLVGPPGCGKTARIQAAAAETGYAVEILRAGLADRIDIGGAIVPDQAAGVARELPLEQLARIRATAQPTLLFLDDLGQAPLDVQASCMRLFDPGYLPPHVLIWAATNRPGDKAAVTALCEPLRSRFDVAFSMPEAPQPDTAGKRAKPDSLAARNSVALGTWRDELDGWCEWALGAGAAPEVVAWHRATEGRTLYQWRPDPDPAARYPDYRSWESVIKASTAGIHDLDSIAACIGVPAAIDYYAYLTMAKDVPSPQEIARAPQTATVPKEASALWLVATACGAAMCSENVGALLTYLGRIPRAYMVLAVRDAWRRGASELSRDPAWSAWFAKNQELFA